MSSPPPDLRPPAPLRTAGLHQDLRHAQSLAGPHQDLLRPGDPPYRLARALLRTLTAGSRPTCPPGLTVHPPVCRGERNLPSITCRVIHPATPSSLSQVVFFWWGGGVLDTNIFKKILTWPISSTTGRIKAVNAKLILKCGSSVSLRGM